MKVLKLLAAPIILLFKTLNGAREFVEDRIADVLDKVQSCETFDTIEKKVITAGVKAGITFFSAALVLLMMKSSMRYRKLL